MIELRSDVFTQPSDGMRRAMAEAVVGDEQEREDPTVAELELRGAELLGQEEAVFVPTATMANQIALRVLSRPGEELLAEENAHVLISEQGGAAVVEGLKLARVARRDIGVMLAELQPERADAVEQLGAAGFQREFVVLYLAAH